MAVNLAKINGFSEMLDGGLCAPALRAQSLVLF